MSNNVTTQVGFIALWDSKRSEYHATNRDEIDTCEKVGGAFDVARKNGAKIFGHYYCRWSTNEKTFTYWYCPSIEVLEDAMDYLERAGDFKFSESEHRIGMKLVKTSQSDVELFSYENGTPELPFAFIAFWKWKESYYRASRSEMDEYESAVDEAFTKARQKGIRMLGQYDCSFTSQWDSFTFWLSPTFEAIEESMDLLEAAGDFKFAESRHIVGYREKGNRFGRKLQLMEK